MRKYSLVGVDGNSFSVMGYVTSAMKDVFRQTKNAKFNPDAQSAYTKKAMSGDYSNLLAVSMDMINEINKAI